MSQCYEEKFCTFLFDRLQFVRLWEIKHTQLVFLHQSDFLHQFLLNVQMSISLQLLVLSLYSSSQPP